MQAMKETQNIEFKRQWRDDFLAELCGFANAQGGTLYIGVDDKGNVVGIENAKQLLEKLPNLINQTMGLLATINLLTEEGKEYLSVSVSATEQPVSYRGKYYYRSGTTLQEMNGNALREFLLRKIGTTWDAFPCEDATMDDIDPAAVHYFLQCAIKAGRMPNEALADNVQTTLSNLDLMTREGKLKNAAVLLFGKRPQHFFISSRFRIGRFMVDDTDLIHHDDIEGNILQMADKVMWKLRQDYLIAPIHYEGMHRVEQLELPEEALRELVYNAIVHRDYLGADTQMKVYNDRIWLWNEGELPEGFSVEKASKEHLSKPRNRLIANVFYKAGFIESWGRGVGKVCKAFANAHLPVPTFENYWGGALVIIPRGQQSEPLNDPNDTLNEPLNSAVNSIQLNDNQRKVFEFISLMAHGVDTLNDTINDTINDKITAEYIAEKVGLSVPTVKRITKFLVLHQLIRRVGSKKSGHWEVVSPLNTKQIAQGEAELLLENDDV